MMVFEDEKKWKDDTSTQASEGVANIDDLDGLDTGETKNKFSYAKSAILGVMLPIMAATNADAMFGEERSQEEVLYDSGFMRTIFSGSLTHDMCEKANLDFSMLRAKKNEGSTVDCEKLKQKISNTVEYLEEDMSNLPKEEATHIAHSLKILRENLGSFDIVKTGRALMSAIAKVDSYVLY